MAEEIDDEKIAVMALYDYTPIDAQEHEFNAQDFFVIQKRDVYKDWVLAYNYVDTEKKEGYIPMEMFVIYDEDIVESQIYYWDVSRKEAERLLEYEPQGTFLVRKAQTNNDMYVLSVRCFSQNRFMIFNHWPIKESPEGLVYLLEHTKKIFNKVTELIMHYYKKEDDANDVIRLTGFVKRTFLAVPFRRFVLDDLEGVRQSKQYENEYDGGTLFHGASLGFESIPDLFVKTYPLKPGMNQPQCIQPLIEQISKLRGYVNKRFVQIMFVGLYENELHIGTEMSSKGNLSGILNNESFRSVKFETYMTMLEQITDGMVYLEENGLFHGDLRARNIQIGDYCEIKIANFGISSLMQIYSDYNNIEDEDRWTAPECNDGICNIKSDVYAFAVLMYEILCFRTIPYPQQSLQNHAKYSPEDEDLDQFLDRSIMMNVPSKMFNYLAMNCWKKNPNDRHTFSELHYFFQMYKPEAGRYKFCKAWADMNI